jgi:hypothetical protein
MGVGSQRRFGVVKTKFQSDGAAMNFSSTPPAKSFLFSGSPCAVLAFVVFVFAAALAPIEFHAATAADPQASTLATLAKIREAWVQDLRTKQLEPILTF